MKTEGEIFAPACRGYPYQAVEFEAVTLMTNLQIAFKESSYSTTTLAVIP